MSAWKYHYTNFRTAYVLFIYNLTCWLKIVRNLSVLLMLSANMYRSLNTKTGTRVLEIWPSKDTPHVTRCFSKCYFLVYGAYLTLIAGYSSWCPSFSEFISYKTKQKQVAVFCVTSRRVWQQKFSITVQIRTSQTKMTISVCQSFSPSVVTQHVKWKPRTWLIYITFSWLFSGPREEMGCGTDDTNILDSRRRRVGVIVSAGEGVGWLFI